MKKLIVVLGFLLIFVAGCSSDVKVLVDNTVEEEKNDYVTYKNKLQNVSEFTSEDDIPCDIITSIDRVNEEEVSYRVILDNPKVDMYDVKALIIHDYFTEDIFPSIGIFDDPLDLIIGDEEVKGIQLVGYIKTKDAIENLNLELRIWIEYKNVTGETMTVYYKPTK